MRALLIFLDGVGLGDDAPHNPFTHAHLPTLTGLSDGQPWLRTTGPRRTDRALFIPTDAGMGVPGRPQSGTGQAAIVTGRPIPALINRHYGPRPDAATRDLIAEGSLFSEVVAAGKSARLLEAYPPGWHAAIEGGKRLPSSYQQAAKDAGLRFLDADDLRAGRALSGDWTGEGWRTHLDFPDMPVLSAYDAGTRLVELAQAVDFAFFPHWLTDMTGHRGPMDRAIELLETFDGVMRGVLDAWDDADGVIVITSDHGNLEDLSQRHHTENPVPTVAIGAAKDVFADLTDLAGIAPRLRELLLD
jgi:hypothetical protein